MVWCGVVWRRVALCSVVWRVVEWPNMGVARCVSPRTLAGLRAADALAAVEGELKWRLGGALIYSKRIVGARVPVLKAREWSR